MNKCIIFQFYIHFVCHISHSCCVNTSFREIYAHFLMFHFIFVLSCVRLWSLFCFFLFLLLLSILRAKQNLYAKREFATA